MKNKNLLCTIDAHILPVFPMGYQQQSTTYYDKTADENL